MKKEEMTDYRKELKGRILVVALEMFKKNGLKAVKMDDISQNLGISKRTLYEIYPNKEDLIFETIRLSNNQAYENLAAHISETSDTMDILTEFFKMRIAESEGICPQLFDDLQYYPKVKKYFEEQKQQRSAQIYGFFLRGQQEGYFLPNIEFDIIREMHSVFSHHFMSNRIYAKYSPQTMLRTMVVVFLRGLCTEVGVKRIDELLESLGI